MLTEQGNIINNQEPDAQVNIVTSKTEIDNKKKVRSFGNKAFDWVVWPTVQWVGVWGFSLFLADQIKNGIGKKWFDAGVNRLSNKLEKFADNKASQKIWGSSKKQWAESVLLIAALSVGGNLLLPITKKLEDKREHISAWFDKKFGKSNVDPDTIKEEPEQTWGSMLKGRLFSSAITYSMFALLGPNKFDKMESLVGGWATKAFMKIRPKANETKVKDWANMAVFDLFLTAMTASVTYLFSRFVATKAQDKKNNAKDNLQSQNNNQETWNTNTENIPDNENLKRPPLKKQSDGWVKEKEAKSNCRLEKSGNHIQAADKSRIGDGAALYI